MPTIHVTKSAAAYDELDSDTEVEIEVGTVKKLLPVDPKLGIGRSVIYFIGGATMNVLESVQELVKRGIPDL